MTSVEQPAGRTLPVTVTYLEMQAHPSLPPVPVPAIQHALMRAVHPPVHFYRYLYDTVGRDWHWVDRKRLSDDALKSIIQDDQVEIYVLHAEGVPAGFAELDFRKFPDVVDLAFFGLVPDFIGRGIGPWLLRWAVDEMWRREPERITVNTCTLDHPSALPMYQRAGFRPYDRRETTLRLDD
ncbi:MAG: GNAT family N-acetyltransferase [Minwuiales bacterium]|nr:GNAT family N-acetyltransferase [Minwuiales bacterium]